MFYINCTKLRSVVVLAFGLLLLGIALQLPRMLTSEITTFITLLSGIGLLSVVVSPVVMISITILSFIPGVRQRLLLCKH